ncbi:MAG TPA: hypothetical protein IAA36_04125 [Candidatus Eubacterium pullicola]|nr:hypothetical protein [Candidatus Eubacterium pullicola]
MTTKTGAKKFTWKKVLLIIWILFGVYVCSRAIFYSVTSPNQVEANGGTTVYDMYMLTDHFMDTHEIKYREGTQEYKDWLDKSLNGELDEKTMADLKGEKWYDDYLIYAEGYLKYGESTEVNSVFASLGYNVVVPKEMRDMTIEDLKNDL